MQTDMKVLGGLPVTIEFDVCGADPEVGIMSAYAEDWRIVAVNGRFPTGGVEWLYKRIDATKGEDDRIMQACNEAIDNYEPDYDYDEPY